MLYRLLLFHNPTLLKPPYLLHSPSSVPVRRHPPRAGFDRPAGLKILHTRNHPGSRKMSGAAIAPCRCSTGENHESLPKKQKISKPNITRIFNFRHMSSVALMLILSASRMVSFSDFSFVVFYYIYLYFLSKVAFPSQFTQPPPPVFTPNTQKIIGLYALFASVIGMFLPIAYIIWGVLVGDEAGVKAAAAHLFLLSSQLFLEGVAFYGGFSLPIFVFVPVFNNTKRIFTLVDWLRSEFYRVDLGYRLYFGRGLAMANLALWGFNLFGFLLPVFLPRAFKLHFSKDE